MGKDPRIRKRKRSEGSGSLAKVDRAALPSPAKQSKTQDVSTPKLELKKHRESLPIYGAREKIIEEIKANKSCILIGETGSGKTTQIPQYLWDYCKGFGGSIAVTQPRRLAAVATATRVAEEVGCEVGDLVGYSVRFDEKTSNRTRIKFLTDGMLVRECMLFPKLEKYSVVILDEAHERSIHTDILCALLREIQRTHRPDLKILIMSATLDADTFQRYFDAKVMYVQGRQFPVSMFYCEKAEQDYVDGTVAAILQIHMTEAPGDILSFLTGREEIENVTKLLRERVKQFPPNAAKLIVCPLYAAQTNEQQKHVFLPTPPGCRKVVIATNIAETSLTVPNIKYVIDCGLVKMRHRAPRNGELGSGRRGAEINILGVVPISQEQAWQRAGRAGRTQPGKCFRLYPESAFLSLPSTQIPEIQRIDLTSLILQLMVIGITDVVNFPYMSPPDRTSIRHALEQLFVLGALDSSKRITDLGRQMALFPLDPAVAKVLIKSKDAGVCEEVISIVALLSIENLFWVPSHKENGGTASTSTSSKKNGDDNDNVNRSQLTHQEVDMAKKTFAAEEGDHLFYLNVYQGYMEAKDKKQWCKDHFVNRRSMEKALDVRKQLVDYWENSARWALASDPTLTTEERIDNIRKTFLSGFFENVAVLLPNGHYQNLRDREEVAIHPSSILAGRKPACVLYRELVLTSRFYMRDVLAIEEKWLVELAPHSYKQTVDASLASSGTSNGSLKKIQPQQSQPNIPKSPTPQQQKHQQPHHKSPQQHKQQQQQQFVRTLGQNFDFGKARPAVVL